MIKRNLGPLLVIIAMLINILNFEYDDFDLSSLKSWLLLLSFIILMASVVLIIAKEIYVNQPHESDSE